MATPTRQTNIPTAAATFDQDERLRWVERVARLMDSQFVLPGTSFRFGLDPILGLLPIVGDLSTFAVSGALLMTMMRHGASGAVVVRMVLNILIDTIVGAIPILGNIFDFAYKSNDRNVALLRAHYAEGKHSGSGRGLLTVVLIGFLIFLAALIWGLWTLSAWLWQYGSQHWW
ncbi:DUF4112 domain-containing protein [Hymenobacter chitinivorans]|uniref:Uncharacterized protein DUF4112 n=1 Tax=Hymenobacter chitinivorans DSM 11115 TaxID=1121954 RepID=A0A2M9BRY8_9BACT|nr:DUF4112 domain-containing protein [Hymenobacter chitinivorans]PJJ60713.1 uncharacterized protein DUF4112 [Hymenobacter chitinivorans DSM 11115]